MEHNMSNTDIEQAVIGCAMNDPMCAQQVASLPQDAFSTIQTKAIHKAIKRIVMENRGTDIINVNDLVKGQIDESQGLLMQMMSVGFLTSNFESYRTQLMGYRSKRIIADAAKNAIIKMSSPSCDMDEVRGILEKAIRQDDMTKTVVSAWDAMFLLDEHIQNRDTNRCYTGIGEFDRITGGLRGGKLIILGARPGVGKTSLALQMAVNVSKQQKVLMVSLEMDPVQLISRVVAKDSGVDCSKFQSGKLSEQDTVAYGSIVGRVANYKLDITTKAATPLQVRSIATKMKYSKQGLSLIVIDYIQLMRSDTGGKSRYEQVSEISRQLKLLAQDLEVPILAMTQFNRESQKDNSIPTMAQAKDSGSIEQDANLFLILHHVRNEPDEVEKPQEWSIFNDAKRMSEEMRQTIDYMQLHIAKNRQGRTGMIDMLFNKPKMTFTVVERR